MKQYYYNNGSNQGPLSADQLQELHKTGQINDDTLIIELGATEWQKYSAVFKTANKAPSTSQVAAPLDQNQQNKELTVGDIITNGIKLGLTNFVPLILSDLLWRITIIIPYINVGTTIAINTIPKQLSKGKMIRPMSIFDEEYRKYMGEYFLFQSQLRMILIAGYFFMIIPGVIMSYSYMFGSMIMIDKGINPTEALIQSNKITDGHKLTIFSAFMLIKIAVFIIPCILMAISAGLGILLMVIFAILFIPVSVGMKGYIYGRLVPAN